MLLGQTHLVLCLCLVAWPRLGLPCILYLSQVRVLPQLQPRSVEKALRQQVFLMLLLGPEGVPSPPPPRLPGCYRAGLGTTHIADSCLLGGFSERIRNLGQWGWACSQDTKRMPAYSSVLPSPLL